MTTHELKSWPKSFAAIVDGLKTYEVRVADRPFAIGDQVLFREWNPETKEYTGDDCQAAIIYLTAAGEWGLPPNLCVFGIDIFG